MNRRVSATGFDITRLSEERVAALAGALGEEAYRVTQKAGTEPAFCGNLLDNKLEGDYCCVVCGLPLFSSGHKFESGTGWPSFWREFDPEHVTRTEDRSHGMVRTEINCARCDAHLGHVFPDGPRPSGERHCLNSASLVFYKEGAERPAESLPAARSPAGTTSAAKTQTAYFAGGCFWGIEHYFQQHPAVIDAVSGYMQGTVDSPTYEQVCSGRTGHAETVKVVYDPKGVSFRQLLEAFFVMHDPTQMNRQGPDVGSQYRSGIYTANEQQKKEAEAFIEGLEREGRYRGQSIVTEVEAAKKFWPAEDYHQDYVAKTGRECHVANPW